MTNSTALTLFKDRCNGLYKHHPLLKNLLVSAGGHVFDLEIDSEVTVYQHKQGYAYARFVVLDADGKRKYTARFLVHLVIDTYAEYLNPAFKDMTWTNIKALGYKIDYKDGNRMNCSIGNIILRKLDYLLKEQFFKEVRPRTKKHVRRVPSTSTRPSDEDPNDPAVQLRKEKQREYYRKRVEQRQTLRGAHITVDAEKLVEKLQRESAIKSVGAISEDKTFAKPITEIVESDPIPVKTKGDGE